VKAADLRVGIDWRWSSIGHLQHQCHYQCRFMNAEIRLRIIAIESARSY
jgi:hypothetical protein